MKYLRSFYKRHRGMAALALLLLLGQVVGTLLIPALIANVVDLGILPGDMDAILRTGGQMLAVALLSAAVAAAGSWVTADLGARFGFEMRSLLLRKSQELSLHQFDEVGVSSMITRTTSDITNLQQTMGMVLQMVVPAPLIVGASIVMTAMVTPVMAVIQVGFMAALAAVAAVVLRKSNALSRSIQVRLDRINRVVREAVTGVRVIRAFGNEAYEEARSGDAYRSYADNMIRLNRLFAVAIPVVWMLMGALMAVVLWAGGVLTLGGGMEVGQITAVTEYSILTMGYLLMAVSVLTTLPKARACLARLTALLDTRPDVEDGAASAAVAGPDRPAVEFDHVSFSYPGAEELVLRDISFTLYPGQTAAVIGSTGSGKSTLADLLLRLHDVGEGAIRVDGADVRALTQEELRERIGCVPQKAFLFSGTIAENLRMGRPDATDEALWRALGIAQAADFVERLPLGLDAPVAQGGTNFSGGQRQRVAFARAIAPSPRLLLLDEPFAAIDAKVRKDLRAWLRHTISRLGVTSIFVTHDQEEAIEVADEIVVTNKGRIEQVGTPVEICMNPKTPFVAQFIGRGTIVSNIRAFSGFAHAPVGHAVVQPEFVHVFSCGEASGQKKELLNPGVVQEVSFRGALYELRIAACGETLNAFRSFEAPPLSPGDSVQFYISRAQGMEGEATLPLNNDRFV